MADFLLPDDFTFVSTSYVGAARTYEVTATGVVVFRMWGGGGGGGVYTTPTTARYGGPGGYLKGQFAVTIGDIITVHNGRGGQVGVVNSNGGSGGWPDGGFGARPSNPPASTFGGGGGSSRIYLNGVLMAICGAGGGAHSFYFGGPGGSLTGGTDASDADNGKGGSQIAGGGGNPALVSAANGWGQNASTSISTAVTGGQRGTQAVASTVAGCGGGGGWWGGGSNAANGTSNQNGAGGGGSSYTKPTDVTSVVTLKSADSTWRAPPDPEGYLTDLLVARGGLTVDDVPGTGYTAGGQGLIIMQLRPDVPDTTLTLDGVNEIEYTGYPVVYELHNNAEVELELWGAGGGGGCNFVATTKHGGAGGYTRVSFAGDAGDIFEVWVGGGGKKPISVDAGTNTAGPTAGGMRGWPDGGWGSRHTTANTGYSGGGGSTRIYRNGTLIAVAGGGGGASGGRNGGNGGGTTGLRSLDYVGNGTGGTQSAGGAAGGASLKGANGGTHRDFAEAGGTSGGGGGYFGGGKGQISNNDASGGGGSGYYPASDPDYIGEMQTAADTVGTPYAGAYGDRPSYVGVGGTCNSTLSTTTDGGAGLARIRVLVASPGDATGGSTPDITFVEPTVGINVGVPEGEAFEDLLLTAPSGVAGSPGYAEGQEAPAVLLQMFLNATGDAEAIVNLPINDGVPIELTPPDVIAGVGATAEGDTIPPIRLTPPRASISGEAEGNMDDVYLTLEAPTGFAEYHVETSGDLATITVEMLLETEVAHGYNITPPSTDGVYATVTLSAPTAPYTMAYGQVGTIVITPPEYDVTRAEGDLDEIVLTAPDAVVVPAFEGDVGTITLTPPEGGSPTTGDATGYIPYITLTVPDPLVQVEGYALGGILDNIVLTRPTATGEQAISPEGDIATISLTPPVFTAAGAVTIAGGAFPGSIVLSVGDALAGNAAQVNALLDPIQIDFAAPTVTMERGANVFAAILPSRIQLSSPRAIATEGGAVVAVGDMEPVFITLEFPDGYAFVVPEGRFPPIYLDTVDAYVEVDEPGFAPLRFKRSITPGVVPTLVEREIAIHEHDSILYSRNAGGDVVGTGYRDFARGYFAPDGGSSGQVLSSAGAWIAPDPEETLPVIFAPANTDRVMLTNEGITALDAAPELDKVYYRPFFLAKPVTIETLCVEVVDTAAATIWMGVCRWDPAGVAGDAIILGSGSAATAGLKQITPNARLEAGWYAGMFVVSGASGVTLRAVQAPSSVDGTIARVGDRIATYTGVLDPPPQPTDRAMDALAIVQAEVA